MMDTMWNDGGDIGDGGGDNDDDGGVADSHEDMIATGTITRVTTILASKGNDRLFQSLALGQPLS